MHKPTGIQKLQLKEVLNDVHNKVAYELEFEIVSVSLVDEDKKEIVTKCGNVSDEWIGDAHHPIDDPDDDLDIQAYVLRTGKTVAVVGRAAYINGKPVDTVEGEDGEDTFCFEGEEFTLDWEIFEAHNHENLSRVFVPLDHIGTIEAGFRFLEGQEPKKIDPDLVKKLEREAAKATVEIRNALAHEQVQRKATVEIQNALAHEQVQRKADMLAKLHDESHHLQTVSQEEDEPGLRQQIADTALRLFQADIVMLYPVLEQTGLSDQAGIRFTRPTTALAGGQRLKVGWQSVHSELSNQPDNIVQEIAKHPEPYFVPDAQDEPLLVGNDRERRHLTFTVHQNILSFAGVPLEYQEDLVGVLCINYRERHQFSDHEKQVFELFAQQAAVIIASNRLVRKEQRLREKNESLHKTMKEKNRDLADSYRELNRQKEYFEAFVLHSPVAIATMDPKARVVAWNAAAEKLFGYKEYEAEGHSIEDLITNTDEMRRQATEFTQRASSEGHVEAVTKRSRKDGTHVNVQLLAIPVRVDGEIGTYVMYHDVDELQHALEQAEDARRQAVAANQAKRDFLSEMSHKLGNLLSGHLLPIWAMKSKAVLAQSRQPNEKAENLDLKTLIGDLEKIISTGDGLKKFCGDTLDLYQIESGVREPNLDTFEVASMVNEAGGNFQTEAEDKGIEWRICCPATVGYMRADRAMICEVLQNLLHNACKFTEKGTIALNVTREYEDSRPWVTFVVKDTGIGMSRTFVEEKLFTPGSQASSSIRQYYGGHGFGLAISSDLCHLMGGRLTAESEGEGEGSTFTISLPANVQDPAVDNGQP